MKGLVWIYDCRQRALSCLLHCLVSFNDILDSFVIMLYIFTFFIRFSDPVTTFINILIVFAPFLRHIPPISFFHKRFLGTFHCMTGSNVCTNFL